MRIAHYVGKTDLTGGTKIIALHQKIMLSLGHEVFWFTKDLKTNADFGVPVTQIGHVRDLLRYDLDLLITNKPKDYLAVRKLKRIKHVYLSQAFELDHLDIRTAKKSKSGIYASRLGAKLLDFRMAQKKRVVNRAYDNDVVKWAVSPYLMQRIESYGAPCYLVRNCFDSKRFRAGGQRETGPVRILSVGNYRLSRKNIPVLFDALKTIDLEYQLIRVSPDRFYPEEEDSSLVAEFHCNVTDEKIAQLYESADILVSPSTDEGFGLPVIEAMACGALCILSDIDVYRRFGDIDPSSPSPYALFFDPKDSMSLSAVLDEAIADTGQFEAIRANGTKLSTHYTYEKTVADLQEALAGI